MNCCIRHIFIWPIVATALIGMFCLTTGWIVNKNHNNSLSPGFCNVTNQIIQKARCVVNCICLADSQGTKQCRTCNKDCYYTSAEFTVLNFDYSVLISGIWQQFLTFDNQVNAQKYLHRYWANGSIHSCHYKTTNPDEFYWQLSNEEAPFIAGLVFVGISAVLGLGWVVIEIVCYVKGAESRARKRAQEMRPKCQTCHTARVAHSKRSTIWNPCYELECETCALTTVQKQAVEHMLAGQDQRFIKSATTNILQRLA